MEKKRKRTDTESAPNIMNLVKKRRLESLIVKIKTKNGITTSFDQSAVSEVSGRNRPEKRKAKINFEISKVKKMKFECVKDSMCSENIDVDDRSGNTVLHYAVRNRDRRVIEYLLSCGADPNRCNMYGFTPLHQAVFFGNVEMVEQLIKSGADVNFAVKHLGRGLAEPIIHEAIQSKRRVPIITLLTSHGIDVTSVDSHDRTALYSAATSSPYHADYTEVLRLILDHHPNLKNDVPDSSEISRYLGQPFEAVLQRGDISAVRLFFNHGLSPLNLKHRHPLHRAALNPHTEVLDYLLTRKLFDPNEKDRHGRTPLHHAVLNNSPEAVELLLDWGVEVSPKDFEGLTPLHLVRYCVNVATDTTERCAELLLLHGADVNAKSISRGRTALNIALEREADSPEVWMLCRSTGVYGRIFRHVCLKQSQGEHVDPINFSQLMSGKRPNKLVGLLHEQCLRELHVMRQEIVADGVKLYDVLVEENGESYSKNKEVMKKLTDPEVMLTLTDRFVNYGGRLRERLARVVERQSLEELAVDKLSKFMDFEKDTFRAIFGRITKLLGRRDLKTLAKV
ncbi:hypothetical protein QAD02_004359 [Eretmocerus hayati]|uniref:Uncharacterized protein n=1 Tax=Eretmocerus hayati TaxID=131215 RepID=A0ACC2NQJ1_9HYME|nr:hypothetical protein QAD02_004359 [Eretmocerus hayati]